MAKVLFDVSSLIPSQLSGLGVYAREMFVRLRNTDLSLTPVYKNPGWSGGNNISKHINQGGRPGGIYKGPFVSKKSILHGTNYGLPIGSSKCKKVLSVFDMAMFHDGCMDPGDAGYFQDTMNTAAGDHLDAVIVPTEVLKGEFLTRYPKHEGKVTVIPHGCDHIFDASLGGHSASEKVTKHPYFLYVGRLAKRKNVMSLLKSFSQLASETPNLDLIICGVDGFGAEKIHEVIERSPLKKRIHKLGYLGPSSLKSLYRNCLAFVYPSLYEGFGMPVVEAMKMGAPVIASNCEALHEVAGGYCHQIDAKNPDDIYLGLKKVHSDTRYRQNLKQLSLKRAEDFSWSKTIKWTSDLYRDL